MSSSSSTEPDLLPTSCNVCDRTENLLRCSRCKSVYYCSKDHQRQDWKKHKPECSSRGSVSGKRCAQRNYVRTVVGQSSAASALPSEGSSEDEVLSTKAEVLNPNLAGGPQSTTEKAFVSAKSAMPIGGENIVQPRHVRDFPEISLLRGPREHVTDEMCRNVIRDMDAYGVCVVDNFLGETRGKSVLREVLDMYTKGIFKDGQLVSSSRAGVQKSIRGDQIAWIDGRERFCRNIGYLIGQVDALIIRANKMLNNGKLGSYNINGRTKVS